MPTVAVIVKCCGRYRLIELDVRLQLVFANTGFHVFEDFRLSSEFPAPVVFGLERVGVEVGLNIAGRTGVCVVAPGSAHTACFFQQSQVRKSCLFEFDGHTDSAESGTDNQNRGFSGASVGHG